jgi:5-methylcytosine-specific restriction endonuclease McrA
MTAPTTVRRCRKCGEDDPSAMARDKRAPGGLNTICHPCAATARRARYAVDPEKERERAARYRAENPENPDKKRERNARRRDENPEKIRRGDARYRAQNRAHWATANPYADPSPKRCGGCKQDRPRLDFSTNPGKASGLRTYCRGCAATRTAERRAKVKGQWVEYVSRSVLWERDGGLCYLCGLPADPARWDLEHIDPIDNGGEHSYINTAVSHPSCNYAKGAKPWPVVAFVA